jgi:hypothetical protein
MAIDCTPNKRTLWVTIRDLIAKLEADCELEQL